MGDVSAPEPASDRTEVPEPAQIPARSMAAELAGRGVASAPGPVARALLSGTLSAAGNAAISRLVQRQPSDAGVPSAPATDAGTTPTAPAPLPATVPPRRNYVFLMGDEIHDAFYINARNFFVQHEPTAQLVTGLRTLAGIIDHVNAGGVPVLKLFIVSHANEEGNLGFSLNAADLAHDSATGDHKPRTTFAEVRDANAAGALPHANVNLIDDVTKIEIKGCNIGRSQIMLDQLDTAFGGHGEVVAPTHKQEYSTTGRGAHMVTDEAFIPYFIEEPGDQTLSAGDLDTRFRTKYPDVPAGRWPALLRTIRRHHEKETSFQWTGVNPPPDNEQEVIGRLHAAQQFSPRAGWTLTYTGRTIVGNDFRYVVRAERMTANGSEWQELTLTTPIPPDPATLIAQERANHGRPDAYIWSAEDTITGNNLTRRVVRERTEWTIPTRIHDATGVAHPSESNQTFYGHSTVTPAPAPTP